MPIMKPANMLPDWADPAQSSVMDPLYKTLARRAASAMGLDDPSSSIMQAAAPSVTPLVSIYADKAARTTGTNMFRKAAYAIKGSPRLSQALDEFASKYPRIAAHIQPSIANIPENPNAMASAFTGYGKINSPVSTVFTPQLAEKVEALPYNAGIGAARNVVFHEGTHTAQALGNSDFDALYRGANKLAGGYNTNPFELTADQAGYAAKTGSNGTPPINNAVSYLKDVLGMSPPSFPKERLEEILSERAARGWTPSGK